MTEWRNPTYNSAGTIDVEIEHSVYGWIPFTASPDDPAGKDIYAAAIATGNIAPYVAPDPVVPDRVTANQFGKQLVKAGLMKQVKAWVSQQDEGTQWSFNRSATFVRDDPMMEKGFTALGYTKEQIDAFFLAASQL